MPILNIEIIGGKDDFSQDLSRRLADVAGSVLNSRQQGTWVKLHFIDVSQYAENGGAIGSLPIIVSLIQAEPPAGAELRNLLLNLTTAIAEVTGHRVENVHIIVEPAAKGRISFGGNLLE